MPIVRALFAAFLWSAATIRAADRCNILLIVADDMGWNEAAYQGSSFYETPNIDRIAREGVAFSNAYSAAPICSPTRAALMTGKAPARLHLTDYIPGNRYETMPLVTPRMEQGLPLAEKTLPEYLHDLGYRSGLFGKWHLAPDYNYQPHRAMDPESQGFDVVHHTRKPESTDLGNFDAHNAVEITDEAIKFIEARGKNPFFCYVAHNVVHRPLGEQPDLVAKYERKRDPRDRRENAVMGAMIERMDTGIGRLLQTLDRLGLAKSTLVIFVSDNGAVEADASQAPFRGGKSTLWEGGIRVPMAIRWPGVTRSGITTDTPVVTQDLFYTVLAAAGASSAQLPNDGVNLLPHLRDGSALGRTALYWHYPHYHHLGDKRPASVIRSGRYKLLEWHEGAILGKGPAVSLFDLEADPGEQHDLAAQKPDLARQMRKQLAEWRRSVGAQEMTARAANSDPTAKGSPAKAKVGG